MHINHILETYKTLEDVQRDVDAFRPQYGDSEPVFSCSTVQALIDKIKEQEKFTLHIRNKIDRELVKNK